MACLTGSHDVADATLPKTIEFSAYHKGPIMNLNAPAKSGWMRGQQKQLDISMKATSTYVIFWKRDSQVINPAEKGHVNISKSDKSFLLHWCDFIHCYLPPIHFCCVIPT